MRVLPGVFLLSTVLAFAADEPAAEHVYRVCHGNDAAQTDCVDKAPHPVYTPDPEYSDKARKKHVNGTVLMDVVVGDDGLVRSVTVTKPLGSGLDEQSVKAVKTWRFEPGLLNGKPVAVKLQVMTSFKLY